MVTCSWCKKPLPTALETYGTLVQPLCERCFERWIQNKGPEQLMLWVEAKQQELWQEARGEG